VALGALRNLVNADPSWYLEYEKEITRMRFGTQQRQAHHQPAGRPTSFCSPPPSDRTFYNTRKSLLSVSLAVQQRPKALNGFWHPFRLNETLKMVAPRKTQRMMDTVGAFPAVAILALVLTDDHATRMNAINWCVPAAQEA
jgi:hypothetical protein